LKLRISVVAVELERGGQLLCLVQIRLTIALADDETRSIRLALRVGEPARSDRRDNASLQPFRVVQGPTRNRPSNRLPRCFLLHNGKRHVTPSLHMRAPL